MPTQTQSATSEKEIRAVIDGWIEALAAKDAKRLAAHYAEGVVAFDLAPPLAHRGAVTLRKGLDEWFPTWRGPIRYEVHDLNLQAEGDLAVGRSLNRMRGTRTSGEETDLWVRATVCFRRIGGAWKIVHEHVSVPFYMDGSFKAAIDLKP
jgi:PhnB protein